MTPQAPIQERSAVAPPVPAPPAPLKADGPSLDTWVRLVISAVLVIAYYAFRASVVEWLRDVYTQVTGWTTRPQTMGVWLVTALIAFMVTLWRKTLASDKRFHAPLLVTSVLVIGDAGFGILLDHHSRFLAWLTGGAVTTYVPTFVAILTTVLAEMLLGRFFWGKWPHIASAYVSGISAGILIKSPELWPFIMCGLISITSKYVLRIGDRHLWNPTNFGVTLMLALAGTHVASLSIEAGNEVWPVLVIWALGGMILYQLKLLHIPVCFLLAFVPLALIRSVATGNAFVTEVAPMTSPMFQLYIFFMITDPKTITKKRWSQCLVAVLVAVAETFYRLVFRDVHSLYHALFTVGPIANLIEIAWGWNARKTQPV